MNDVFLTGHHIRCAPGDEPDTILARIFAGDRPFCRMHPALGIPVFRMSGAEDESVPARRRALALLRDSAERAFGGGNHTFTKVKVPDGVEIMESFAIVSKVLQEIITLIVFVAFSAVAFHMPLRWNHAVACLLLIGAVYFVFGFK